MAMTRPHEVLVVRVPKGTRKRLKRIGDTEDRSMNYIICKAISAFLASSNPKNRKAA
jgi:predicted transcriptional regulator